MAMGSGCPGGDLHPSRAWWTGLGLGFSEALCLARGLFPLLGGPFLGLPLCVPALSAYPVLLGTRLTARLVRDEGSPACDTEPEGLGLLPFSLGRGGVCFPCAPASARTRAGSALWLRPRQVWAPPGALASLLIGWRWLIFLLDLSLFGVRMTKVLSKMRSLEPPGWAGETLPVHLGAKGPCRSIPAWAGEPNTSCFGDTPSRVYPHVGGGTPSGTHIQRGRHGLSPHGRGNPGSWSVSGVTGLSIPAWAGEPRLRMVGCCSSASKQAPTSAR